MSYTQLTQEERYQICALKKAGHLQAEIAEIVGHDPGTIRRELRRNRGLKGYRPQQAHKLALARRFGDWEGGTLIGKGHRGALVMLVGRKSLYTVIRSMIHKTAEAVRAAVRDGLTPYIDRVHTITYDNGREFADHEGMARDLDARIHFAHPYASPGNEDSTRIPTDSSGSTSRNTGI